MGIFKSEAKNRLNVYSVDLLFRTKKGPNLKMLCLTQHSFFAEPRGPKGRPRRVGESVHVPLIGNFAKGYESQNAKALPRRPLHGYFFISRKIHHHEKIH